MSFRFLYLNEAGEEVEVGGLEQLRVAVSMGRVDEDTLLYDAETREWAPARAHSAYRLLLEDTDGDPAASQAASAEAEATPPAPPADGEGGAADDEADIDDGMPDFTALLEPVIPDTTEAFIEQQQRERELDDVDVESVPTDLHLVGGDDELADRSKDVSRPPREPVDEAPAPVAPPADARPEPPREREPAGPPETPRRPDPGDDLVVPRRAPTRKVTPIRRSRVGRRRSLGAWILGSAAGIALIAWGVTALGPGAQAGGPPPGTPPPAGTVPDRVAAAQGSAFEDMVLAMDSLREVHDLSEGPGDWLDGHYLATASEYPNVEAYWRRYLDFVAALRAQDTALYRDGLAQRLRGEGVEGPMLSMRLARGLDAFRASQPARDSLYRGMEELADAALDLHALLLEREADIEYDPVQAGTVSRDPVMEAVPRDAELRDALWAGLDRIFEAMDVVQGGVPGPRDRLTDASLQGIRQSPNRPR